MSQWLHKRLTSALEKNVTPAILVNTTEVKDKSLDCLKHLHHSDDFRHDLALDKCSWIYTNDEAKKRVLVLAYKD